MKKKYLIPIISLIAFFSFFILTGAISDYYLLNPFSFYNIVPYCNNFIGLFIDGVFMWCLIALFSAIIGLFIELGNIIYNKIK